MKKFAAILSAAMLMGMTAVAGASPVINTYGALSKADVVMTDYAEYDPDLDLATYVDDEGNVAFADSSGEAIVVTADGEVWATEGAGL